MFDFKEEKIKNAFEQQFGNRIFNLAAAGSIVNGRSNNSSDLDLLLVLSKREQDDLRLCRIAVKNLNMYKIDLSLKYLDELPVNPADFQDGSKTSLSLAYISSAHFIIGENIFTGMFNTLPLHDFRKSIIHTVGDYLMRMEGEFFAANDNEMQDLQKQCFKYLTRIIIDVQLFFKPSDMKPYKLLTKEDMLRMGKEDNRIKHYINSITQDSPADEIITAMSKLHSYLNQKLLVTKDTLV